MLDPSNDLIAAWQELSDAQKLLNGLDFSRLGLDYLNQSIIQDIDRVVNRINHAHDSFRMVRYDLSDRRK